jgi:rifampicin phosphotransferase
MGAIGTLEERPLRPNALLDLRDERAKLVELSGPKAANLAQAQAGDFPVVPGFVLTTELDGSALADEALRLELRRRWEVLSFGGTRPLVVRSSSAAEDGTDSSMAGMFKSVTGVRTWPELLDAIGEVLASAFTPLRSDPAPMAVLVQLQVDAVLGGVMFGHDPLSGRRDRIVVAAVEGSPEKIVGGFAADTRFVLNQRGRVLERTPGVDDVKLTGAQRRALVRLAQRAAMTFGRPQDIEWAEDAEGRLWLLQSRPVTAISDSATATGPVLGPGPVAETFPYPLTSLEQDLWLQPFREGLKRALTITGAQSRKRIESSPIVTAVGGRAAVDLDLLKARPGKRSLLARLDPRPPARRLAAAWRVGRLRASLSALSQDLLARVEDELASVPALVELPEDKLVDLLRRSRQMLISLHGHEALAGMLMPADAHAPTAAAIGLRSLAEARHRGTPESSIVATYPEVLALNAPGIVRKTELPPTPRNVPSVDAESHPVAAARESLRFAARLVQELSARAALELGRRAASREFLPVPEDVAALRFDELEAALQGKLVALEVDLTREREEPPLPAAFRLSASGAVVAEKTARNNGAQGAGGGRAVGIARTRLENVEPGDVLIVRTLDPQLAGALPRLGGLVAETGSVLSHLAILAREYRIPTVIGVADAIDRFPEGSTVIVEGDAGTVSLSAEDEQ